MSLDRSIEPMEQGQDDALALPANWRPRRAGAALSIFAVDVVAVLIFSALSGFVFLTPQSLSDIALDGSESVLLCIGVAFLLGAGELDISVGANVILSSVVGGKTMASFANPLVGILSGAAACLACGAAVGAFNAAIVTRLRVTSFIATLASLGIVTGTAYVITDGYNISDVPLSLQSNFGVAKLGGVVPYPALIAVAFATAASFVVRRTRFGLHTLALGSSREAAVRAGIKVRRNLTVLFVLTGCCAGVSGFIDLSRYASSNLSGHQTDALAAIAGAVIGGTSLFGGRISVWGAVFGALLAVILQDGLVVIGLAAFYQLIAVGVVLIIAVSLREFAGNGDEPALLTGRLISLLHGGARGTASARVGDLPGGRPR
jgi:ribose transport system permease protein